MLVPTNLQYNPHRDDIMGSERPSHRLSYDVIADVLDNLKEVKIAVKYLVNGKELLGFPGT